MNAVSLYQAAAAAVGPHEPAAGPSVRAAATESQAAGGIPSGGRPEPSNRLPAARHLPANGQNKQLMSVGSTQHTASNKTAPFMKGQ